MKLKTPDDKASTDNLAENYDQCGAISELRRATGNSCDRRHSLGVRCTKEQCDSGSHTTICHSIGYVQYYYTLCTTLCVGSSIRFGELSEIRQNKRSLIVDERESW